MYNWSFMEGDSRNQESKKLNVHFSQLSEVYRAEPFVHESLSDKADTMELQIEYQ